MNNNNNDKFIIGRPVDIEGWVYRANLIDPLQGVLESHSSYRLLWEPTKQDTHTELEHMFDRAALPNLRQDRHWQKANFLVATSTLLPKVRVFEGQPDKPIEEPSPGTEITATVRPELVLMNEVQLEILVLISYALPPREEWDLAVVDVKQLGRQAREIYESFRTS